MPPDEKIIDRIKKLLALAGNNNSVEEAASAAAQAQLLMSKHRIEETMLAATPEAAASIQEEPILDVFQPAEGTSKVAVWALTLANDIGEANDCKVYRYNKIELRVVGRPSDAQTARYLYTYLVAEIERLLQKSVRERCEAELISAALVDKVWRTNFKIGAVHAIGVNLRLAKNRAQAEMRKEAVAGDTLGNGVALVRVNNALAMLEKNQQAVARRVARLGLKQVKSHNRYDESGRAAGERAGRSINLSSGRPLEAGAKGALKP